VQKLQISVQITQVVVVVVVVVVCNGDNLLNVTFQDTESMSRFSC